MTIPIELNGKKRKTLVAAISQHLGVEAVYKNAPSYAYEFGAVTLDRENRLHSPAEVEQAALTVLLDALTGQGFGVGEQEAELQQSLDTGAAEPAQEAEVDTPAETEPTAEATPTEEPSAPAEPESATSTAAETPESKTPVQFTIELPLTGFDPVKLDNLSRLIDSKAGLIRKAMAVPDLPVKLGKETMGFPWFRRELMPQEVTAYTHFLSLLAEMAKRQARVLAVEREVENEKYAFRCFLLRLGMIGSEYGESRRILLRHLVGNGSMKSGERRTPPAPAIIPAAEPAATPEEDPEDEQARKSPASAEGGFSLKGMVGGVISALKLW